MTHKKGDTLCSHPAFYSATFKRFSQVKQILHDHSFCKIQRICITIVDKKETEFSKIITDRLRAVMAER